MRVAQHINGFQSCMILNGVIVKGKVGLFVCLSTGILWSLNDTAAFAQSFPHSPASVSSPILIAQVPASSSHLIFVNQVLGNDAGGDGSQRSPFRTITRALQSARPGSVILLGAGTYTAERGEQFPLVVPVGVRLQADPGVNGQPVRIRGGGVVAIANSPTTSANQSVAVLAQSADSLSGIQVQNPRGETVRTVPTAQLARQTNTGNTPVQTTQPARSITPIAAPASLLPLAPEQGITTMPPRPTPSPQAVAQSPAFPSPNQARSQARQTSGDRPSSLSAPFVAATPATANRSLEPGSSQALPTVTVTRNPNSLQRSGSNTRNTASPTIARAVPIPVAPPASAVNQQPVSRSNPPIPVEVVPVGRGVSAPQVGSAQRGVAAPATVPVSVQRSASPVRAPQRAVEIPVPPPAMVQVAPRPRSQVVQQPVPQPAQQVAARRPPVPRSSQLLPVPSQEPPLGYTGSLRRISIPGVSVGQPGRWSGQQANRNSLRYRVLVLAEGDRVQEQVRSLIPGAFVLNYQGRTVMQTGAFSTRDNAEEAVATLSRSGLQAVIRPMD